MTKIYVGNLPFTTGDDELRELFARFGTQWFLGFLYLQGRGVRQDSVHAYKWFSLAGNAERKAALGDRDVVLSLMNPDQVNQGQVLLEELLKQTKTYRPTQAQTQQIE